MVEKILFLVFAFLTVAGGIGTISRRNIIHALLLLIFTFVNIAAIFFISQAYFIAVVQILVYAGAIMVLFVFVVMFLNLRTFQQEEQTHRGQRWVALLLSALVLAEFVIVLAGTRFSSVLGGQTPDAINQAGGSTRVFSRALFNDMLLPFEVASIVLLVAMVGAVILVKRERSAGVATRKWESGEQLASEIAEEEV